LNIQSEEFKLCRNLMRHEYKRLDDTLENSGLFDGAAIIVEKGIPLQPNQFHFKYSIYDMNKIDPWLDLQNPQGESWIVSEDMLISDIKKQIAMNLNVTTSFIRLRERAGNKPGKTLSNDKTLKECINKLYDGQELVIQLLETEDTVISTKDTDLIIELQKWLPSVWELEKEN